jgi:hypothetical protein
VLRAKARRAAGPLLRAQLIDLFRSYFEGALNENSIKRNFVLMYELLDEVMDFGFPQVTEPSVLKNFIFQKGIRSEVDLVGACCCCCCCRHGAAAFAAAAGTRASAAPGCPPAPAPGAALCCWVVVVPARNRQLAAERCSRSRLETPGAAWQLAAGAPPPPLPTLSPLATGLTPAHLSSPALPLLLQAKDTAQAQNATLTVTGAVGWRREGIKYKKNEVFLDIVEQVNLLMNNKGGLVGCWLLAAGLLAAGCLAAGCWLLNCLAAGCWLLAAGCWLLACC